MMGRRAAPKYLALALLGLALSFARTASAQLTTQFNLTASLRDKTSAKEYAKVIKPFVEAVSGSRSSSALAGEDGMCAQLAPGCSATHRTFQRSFRVSTAE
jgi:hypothetical protein